MDSISIMLRWKLRKIALQEAQSEYKNCLIEYKKSSIRNTDSFTLSPYMEQLIKEYVNDCTKLSCKFWKWHLNRVYAKVLKYYAILDSKNNVICEEKEKVKSVNSEIDKKIKEHQQNIEKWQEIRQRADMEGIKPDMNVSHYGKITAKIKDSEQEIERLEKVKTEKNTQLENFIVLPELKKQEHKKPFYKLIPAFKKNYDLLGEELELIYSEYDKIWSYYWKILCKKCGVVAPLLSFEQICLKLEHSRLKKADYFKDECNFINSSVSLLTNMKIKI